MSQIGPRKAVVVRDGMEMFHIHAARPDAQAGEAMRRHLAPKTFGRHHHGGGRSVKPAQPAIDQRLREQGKTRPHIVRKAGMERRGESNSVFQTDGARAHSQSAFGGDMHRVGREIANFPFQPFARQHRQPDFPVGRKPDGEAPFRRRIADIVAQRGQVFAQHFQGAHHAIDLRAPGIGDDEDLQMRRDAGNGSRHQTPCPTRE